MRKFKIKLKQPLKEGVSRPEYLKYYSVKLDPRIKKPNMDYIK